MKSSTQYSNQQLIRYCGTVIYSCCGGLSYCNSTVSVDFWVYRSTYGTHSTKWSRAIPGV